MVEEGDESNADRIEIVNPKLSDTQKTDLDWLLDKHADMVCEEIGRVLCTFHAIDTGTTTSIRTCRRDWPLPGGPFSFRDGHSQTLPQPLVLSYGPHQEAGGSVRLCVTTGR